MTTSEKIVIAAIVDAGIEYAIKERQERERLLNNLIGKKYVPRDNSYIREIVNGKKMDYHCSLIGVPCMIVSRPYITEVKSVINNKKERMITVKSLKTGLRYEVMFAESWIQD